MIQVSGVAPGSPSWHEAKCYDPRWFSAHKSNLGGGGKRADSQDSGAAAACHGGQPGGSGDACHFACPGCADCEPEQAAAPDDGFSGSLAWYRAQEPTDEMLAARRRANATEW